MALRELKGEYITIPFMRLHQLYEQKTRNSNNANLDSLVDKLPISDLPSFNNQKGVKEEDRIISKEGVIQKHLQFNYLLIDFYEWLSIIQRNPDYRQYVEESDFIVNNINKYKEFFIYTSYRISSRARLEKVLNEYLDSVYLNDLFIMYEIFMRYIEKTQLQFLNIYKNNTATNPVALIPWSYGLNRLASTLYIIKDDPSLIDPYLDYIIRPNRSMEMSNSELVDSSAMLITEIDRASDLKDLEGLTNVYHMRAYDIQDQTPRFARVSPICLYNYEVNTKNEKLLSNNWKEIFENSVKRDTKKYIERLILIKSLFSQYLFYGRHKVGNGEVFYLNYPFKLPGLYATPDNGSVVLTPKIGSDIEEVLELDEQFENY